MKLERTDFLRTGTASTANRTGEVRNDSLEWTGTDRNGRERTGMEPERTGTDQNGTCCTQGPGACQYASNPGLLDRNQAWSEQLEPVTVGTGPERNVSRARGGAEVQTGLPADRLRIGTGRPGMVHNGFGSDRNGPERHIPEVCMNDDPMISRVRA